MPNSRVCPVCLGLPGALPVVSEEYVRLGVRAGLALGCTIQLWSAFDRKHYFYPDLPKGYQITQYDAPLCTDGAVDVQGVDMPVQRRVRIERIHLEEDAGKSLHAADAYSYIDFNRCGVPLIEIVSRPDLRSAEEAACFMQTIREILTFIEVTDGNLEEGALRCDANVNVRILYKGQEHHTPISEIKNMNSYRMVRDACTYEVQRQLQEFWQKGPASKEEMQRKRTMGWDPVEGVTLLQRTKHSLRDYRFMRDPDLPDLHLTPAYVQHLSYTVGELPAARRARFKLDLGLSAFAAQTLTGSRMLADWFEKAAHASKNARRVANWILSEVLAVVNEKNICIAELNLSPEAIAELMDAVEDQRITGKQAKDIFAQMLATGARAQDIISAQGLAQLSDEEEIATLVQTVFQEHPKALRDWQHGKTNVAAWLMGQVMKRSRGRAHPARVATLVHQALSQL